MAYISGLIPRRTSWYSIVEIVLMPAPLVKYVIIKSSREMVNAIKNPAIMPGMSSGRTTLIKAYTGPAPRSSAAS